MSAIKSHFPYLSSLSSSLSSAFPSPNWSASFFRFFGGVLKGYGCVRWDRRVLSSSPSPFFFFLSSPLSALSSPLGDRHAEGEEAWLLRTGRTPYFFFFFFRFKSGLRRDNAIDAEKGEDEDNTTPSSSFLPFFPPPFRFSSGRVSVTSCF